MAHTIFLLASASLGLVTSVWSDNNKLLNRVKLSNNQKLGLGLLTKGQTPTLPLALSAFCSLQPLPLLAKPPYLQQK